MGKALDVVRGGRRGVRGGDEASLYGLMKDESRPVKISMSGWHDGKIRFCIKGNLPKATQKTKGVWGVKRAQTG